MSLGRLRKQQRHLDFRGGCPVASIWLGLFEAGVNRGTSCARSILDVTIKPRMSSAHPVSSIVAVNPRSGAHEAEEDVPGRPDHDSYMSVPNDQIARLRMFDPLKSLDPVVKIIGTGVG